MTQLAKRQRKEVIQSSARQQEASDDGSVLRYVDFEQRPKGEAHEAEMEELRLESRGDYQDMGLREVAAPMTFASSEVARQGS